MINSMKNTQGHIIIKLLKVKHKKRIMKAIRKKKVHYIQGNSIPSMDFLSPLLSKRELDDTVKMLKGKKKEYLPRKTIFLEWKRDKDFSRETKTEEVHHYQTCLTRNAEQISTSLNKKMPNNTMKVYESINLTGKGNCNHKHRIL